MRTLRASVRRRAEGRKLSAVVAYAFDASTRMLPFVFVDKWMAPGGPRAVASALVDAGIETRVVLQQWNPRFDPALMQLDGRLPDLFLVSSMGIHGRAMDGLLRRIQTVDPADRPLVLAGGPRTNYEPWRVFGSDPSAPWGADVATTGEVYVLLALLDLLLAERAKGEPLRRTFFRLRDHGWLDHIPGLVYARGAREGVAEELVDTGVQRLLADLDELPDPVAGFACLEPPGRNRALGPRPLPPERVRRYTPIASIEMTYGCRFRCPYCPIPAYNQHQDRRKSPERIVAEFRSLYETYGITRYFGTDDNFFNRKDRAFDIIRRMERARLSDRTPLAKRTRWATEVTVHDTYEMHEHLPLARKAGVRALWLGVEDMTATLVKKGQSIDKTRAVFHALRDARIHPMPMMMHDDGQPLLSWRGARGLLNQAQLLRSAGAMTFQVLYLTPAHGSKLYNETYESGLAYASAGGHPVDESMLGGNYVVASRHPRPWFRQLDAILAYLWFYNPLRFLKALVLPTNRKRGFYDASYQVFGMLGLLFNLRRAPWWILRLLRGPVVRASRVPRPHVPMRAPDAAEAAHDIPEGPDPKRVRRLATPSFAEDEEKGLRRRGHATLSSRAGQGAAQPPAPRKTHDDEPHGGDHVRRVVVAEHQGRDGDQHGARERETAVPRGDAKRDDGDDPGQRGVAAGEAVRRHLVLGDQGAKRFRESQPPDVVREPPRERPPRAHRR